MQGKGSSSSSSSLFVTCCKVKQYTTGLFKLVKWLYEGS